PPPAVFPPVPRRRPLQTGPHDAHGADAPAGPCRDFLIRQHAQQGQFFLRPGPVLRRHECRRPQRPPPGKRGLRVDGRSAMLLGTKDFPLPRLDRAMSLQPEGPLPSDPTRYTTPLVPHKAPANGAEEMPPKSGRTDSCVSSGSEETLLAELLSL